MDGRNTTARSGCLNSPALHKLLRQNVDMKVVSDGILRQAIRSVFDWRYITTPSIGEHNFIWDAEKGLISCKIFNGEGTKMYNVGKGIRKIASLLKVIAPVEEDKIKKLALFLEGFGKGELRVVGGEDVCHFYLDEQIDKEQPQGSMSGGCMRWDSYTPAVRNMYAANANMLILESSSAPGKILGRANLWVCDDGTKLMDRIYGDESHTPKFKEWAMKNGYYHRERQTYYGTFKLINPEGENVRKKLEVTIDMAFWKDEIEEHQFSTGRLPYMDTFKYLNADSGRMINFAPDYEEEGTWYKLENTNGHCERIRTDTTNEYQYEN